MAVAAVLGLLLPSTDEGSPIAVAGGCVAGILFVAVSRRALAHRDVHWGELDGAGVRRSALVFGVLFVHSLPEGFAVGSAYASTREGLGLFVILAIALQNVPEGTSVAIPMAASGFSGWQQFWAAVLTSLPQPIGAAIAFVLVEEVQSVLPFSFAFAGAAMLLLTAVELVPQAFARGGRQMATAGVAAGAAMMVVLSALLGV
jgi:ZIP family zinc transporter